MPTFKAYALIGDIESVFAFLKYIVKHKKTKRQEHQYPSHVNNEFLTPINSIPAIQEDN